VKFVDSHCHLDDEKFDADRDAVIERALATGVEIMMAIGTGGELDVAIRLAEKYPFIYATIGVHPHDAVKASAETFDRLRDLASHPKVLAIGEIGLDYHYDFSPRDVQHHVFDRQLEIAAEFGKPIVIHTREAWEDTMAHISSGPAALPHGGIMHCFTGDSTQARQALALGFHLSFGGVLTFPKADAVREAARIIPENRLLIETDCPYLAPVPHRGARNEPAFVIETARRLAAVRGVPIEEIASATTRNFRDLCLRVPAANG
jgi:TatD DNase family protein